MQFALSNRSLRYLSIDALDIKTSSLTTVNGLVFTALTIASFSAPVQRSTLLLVLILVASSLTACSITVLLYTNRARLGHAIPVRSDHPRKVWSSTLSSGLFEDVDDYIKKILTLSDEERLSSVLAQTWGLDHTIRHRTFSLRLANVLTTVAFLVVISAVVIGLLA